MKKIKIKLYELKAVRKIKKQAKNCRLNINKRFISVYIILACTIAWMILHFCWLRYVPGCWLTYHLGVLLEYILPAILVSTIFYYLFSLRVEYKRERNIANIIFLYAEEKLFSNLVLEEILSSMCNLLSEYLPKTEYSTQGEKQKRMYKANYRFKNIRNILLNLKLEFNNDMYEELVNESAKCISTTDTVKYNQLLINFLESGQHFQNIKKLDDDFWNLNSKISQLINSGIIQYDNILTYILNEIKSCDLTLNLQQFKGLDNKMGKFKFVYGDLKEFNPRKNLHDSYIFLSTNLYLFYLLFRNLYEYVDFYKVRKNYKDLREQSTLKRLNGE